MQFQERIKSMRYLVEEGFTFAKPLANLTYREMEVVASNLLDKQDNLPQETRDQILTGRSSAIDANTHYIHDGAALCSVHRK